MTEPIARAIVRDVFAELRKQQIDFQRLPPDRQIELRERLVHVVDAGVKRGILRLLDEPTLEPTAAAGV